MTPPSSFFKVQWPLPPHCWPPFLPFLQSTYCQRGYRFIDLIYRPSQHPHPPPLPATYIEWKFPEERNFCVLFINTTRLPQCLAQNKIHRRALNSFNTHLFAAGQVVKEATCLWAPPFLNPHPVLSTSPSRHLTAFLDPKVTSPSTRHTYLVTPKQEVY